MELNWTALTYAVIALFALSGFFKGWWKEAIMTSFLAVLVLLLQNPPVAEATVDIFNQALAAIWQLMPPTLQPTLNTVLNIDSGAVPQVDPGDAGTWLLILILFAAAAIVVGRSGLPNHGAGAGYAVRPMASVLGGLLGGLNGFIIMGLIREYLDGRNLPGGNTLPGEVSSAASGVIGRASSGVSIQAVDVPAFTLLDSYLPWVLIAFGGLIFLAALRSRVALVKSPDGFRKIEYKQPFGYKRYGG